MLPEIDGFAVCEQIRKENQVSGIMLTKRDGAGSQMEKVDALAGVYITKLCAMPLVPLNIIWGCDYFGDAKSVNAHIRNIRRNRSVHYIEMFIGLGFKIEKENQKELC